MSSSSELLVPVGGQIVATCGGPFRVEHLQIEGTDIALVLGSDSRQLWTQPEGFFVFVPSDAEMTSVPTGLARVAAFVVNGKVALA